MGEAFLTILVALLIVCAMGVVAFLPPTFEAHLGALCFGLFMTIFSTLVRAWKDR